MKLSIRVYYRLEFISVIASFISETARIFGATDEEVLALCLASDETGMLIINSFPPEDSEDVFEVSCNVLPDGLEFEFKNLGTPLNIDALPAYDPSSPDSTIEGLGQFLAGKMVDRLEFINRGNEGWCTTIFKKLGVMIPFATLNQAPPLDAAKETISSKVAGAADAHDIVQLAYHNYRYTYSKESFYYVDKLKNDLAEKRIVSFVAKTGSGAIVGHVARMIDPANPVIAEYGAIMIRPEYRKSIGLLSLVKAVKRYDDEFSERIHLSFTNLVTSHTMSQKLAAILSFKPMAVNFSTHDRAKYIGIDTDNGRESNLYAVNVIHMPGRFTVYVPEVHAQIANLLFTNIEMSAEIVCEPVKPAVAETRWTITTNNKTQYARLVMEEVGEDVETAVRAKSYQLLAGQIVTATIYIPCWKPLPPDIDDVLKKQFFFFSGFVPAAPDRWYIVYTRLTNQRFNFDGIHIHDPAAVKLLEYIKQCCNCLVDEPVHTFSGEQFV